MAINVIDDETGQTILRVHGAITSPLTWADLVDGCTRAWITQFNPGALVKKVPLWARLRLGLVAAGVVAASMACTFGAADAGRNELGMTRPRSELSTAQIAVAWVVTHIDDPFEALGWDLIGPEAEPIHAERAILAQTPTSKGSDGKGAFRPPSV